MTHIIEYLFRVLVFFWGLLVLYAITIAPFLFLLGPDGVLSGGTILAVAICALISFIGASVSMDFEPKSDFVTLRIWAWLCEKRKKPTLEEELERMRALEERIKKAGSKS